jgi:hypothetical protein
MNLVYLEFVLEAVVRVLVPILVGSGHLITENGRHIWRAVDHRDAAVGAAPQTRAEVPATHHLHFRVPLVTQNGSAMINKG